MHIPQPAPWTDPESLTEARRRLEEARAYHQQRIAAAQESADDITSAIASRSESALEEVEEALASLEAGEYGTCVSCREAIHPERLDALPHARRCAACASQRMP